MKRETSFSAKKGQPKKRTPKTAVKMEINPSLFVFFKQSGRKLQEKEASNQGGAIIFLIESGPLSRESWDPQLMKSPSPPPHRTSALNGYLQHICQNCDLPIKTSDDSSVFYLSPDIPSKGFCLNVYWLAPCSILQISLSSSQAANQTHLMSGCVCVNSSPTRFPLCGTGQGLQRKERDWHLLVCLQTWMSLLVCVVCAVCIGLCTPGYPG